MHEKTHPPQTSNIGPKLYYKLYHLEENCKESMMMIMTTQVDLCNKMLLTMLMLQFEDIIAGVRCLKFL